MTKLNLAQRIIGYNHVLNALRYDPYLSVIKVGHRSQAEMQFANKLKNMYRCGQCNS